MTTITAGSGLGAFAAVARCKKYGETFETPTRTLYFKTFKPTHNPHIVQGGPYLAGGRIADISSAHIKMYTDAMATLTGDVMTSGQALLLAAAFGSNGILEQAGTTTAYELGGASGINLEASEKHNGTEYAGVKLEVGKKVKNITYTAGSIKVGALVTGPKIKAGTTVTSVAGQASNELEISANAEEAVASETITISESPFLDLQVGIPYTNAEVVPYNYHSGVVTKAEFVFDRIGLCSYSYDIDFREIENNTALITPVFTTNGVPFAMNEGSSEFKIGLASGGITALQGVRKMTVTLEHKFATDRIYLGEEKKALPVSNGLVDITVSMEADFTESAKSVFAAFLKNEALKIEAIATGAEIGSSGKRNLFSFTMPNVFINSGAEPPIDGPDLVKNTLSARATIDATNDAVVSAKLITSDTTF
jgi:hypothetical protein